MSNTEKRDPSDQKSFNAAYWALRPFWVDCLNLKEPLPYATGVSGIAQYLNRYLKEDDSEFAERIKRIAQVNFVDLIVDSFSSMLFSTTVEVKSEKYQDKVQAFVKSCNQQGDNLIDYFAEMIAPTALTYGVCDVFVDLPKMVGENFSVLQQEEAGLNKPFCYVVPPLNRVYWKTDDAGNYVEYQSQDIIDTQINTTYQVKDQNQYTLWTVDNVTIYDGQGVQQGEPQPNPYKMIPAVTVVPRYPLRYYKDRIGLSLIQDVIGLQKLVINLISLILDFHENVNFGQRVIVQDTDQGDEPPTEGELQEGGNKRGLVLRGKGSDYRIITPDAAGVESMRNFLASVIEWTYQSVSMPSDSNTNKTHQTGQTIRSNQAVLFNKLSKITKHFERSIKQIVDMSLKVQGIKDDAGVTVHWDRNFSYEAFITALQQLQMLKATTMDISPTLVAEYTKSVAAPQLYASGKMPTIEKEADAWAKRMIANPPPTPGEQADINIESQNQQINAAQKTAATEESS